MSDVAISMGLIDRVTGGLRGYERTVDSLHAKQMRYTREAEAGQRRLAAGYARLGGSIDFFTRKATTAGQSIFRSFQTATRATLMWGGVASGAAAGAMGLLLRQGIKLNDEMERYRITLTTVMRSQEKANSQIAWMIRFAEKTPFDVQGLVQASAQLEAFGLNSRKWIPLVGDLSATFGGTTETVNELVDALGKLKSGLTGIAFRSIRRFGISNEELERRGARFDKRGELLTPPDEALGMLEDIIKSRFGGMMQNLLGTYTGVTSNLMDMATNMLRETTKPLFDRLRGAGGGLLGGLDELRDSGVLGYLTGRVGGGINALAGRAGNFLSSNILQPLMGGASLKDVGLGLFDQIKTPAAEFIRWFAGTMVSAIWSSLKILMSSSEGRALLGYGAAWRYGETAIGLLGDAVKATGTYFGGRGIARAIAGRGAAASAPAMVGRFTTPLMAAQAGAASPGAVAMSAANSGAWMLPGWGTLGAAGLAGNFLGTAAYNALNPMTANNWQGRTGRWLGTKASEWWNGPVNEFTGNGAAWGMQQHAAGVADDIAKRFGQSGVSLFTAMRAERGGMMPTTKEFESAWARIGATNATDNIRDLAGEFTGLNQSIAEFAQKARDDATFAGNQLSDMLEGLSRDFLTAEERINRLTRAMPTFSQQINSSYLAAGNAALLAFRDPTRAGAAVDALNMARGSIMGMRNKQAEAEMALAVERFKLRGDSVERNRGLLGHFSEVYGDPMEVARLREQARSALLFNAGQRDLKTNRLIEINKATGLINPDAMRRRLIDDFIGSDTELRGLFDRSGGFSQTGGALQSELERIGQRFKLLSEQDIANLDAVLQELRTTIPDAFEDGAQKLAEKLRQSLAVTGVELSQAMKDDLVGSIRGLVKELQRQGGAPSGYAETVPTGY
ncbi:hypothetical protein RAS2_16950 [Phycisphaerae bacterium RAS2]|nr:hypothetical protein RAS2_16950 [Phycisphaerae bacterium RAS2]